ncbi:MAG: copper resistance protein CopC/CopD [Actinobacteria bacterium]|nr:copper resistance protein CopC/CopD [Actinomycetota bacterium]
MVTADPTVSRRRAWLRRAAAVATVCAAALLSTATAALGHAAFVTSQPAPGSQLTATPGVVVVRFSEPLIADLSSLEVEAPTGQRFEATVADDREMHTDLPTNAQGEYVVRWKTVSPIDGHTLRGDFRFSVGAAVSAGADEPSVAPTGTDLAVAAGRAVEYAALLGVLGALLLRLLARREPQLRWLRPRLHVLTVLAAVAGVIVVGGEVLLATSSLAPRAVASFLTAPSGTPRLVRLGGEAAAAAATLLPAVRWAKERPDADRIADTRARVVGVGTVVALIGLAAAGHAAATQPTWWGVTVDAGHLVTAGLWAGAILVMAVQRPPGGWRGEQARELLMRFSPVAVPAFVGTVAFGVVRGAQELASLRDLIATSYGQVLGLKIIAVVLMVPLSLRAWRRRAVTARAEAFLALVAVVAAAVLAAYPVPPRRGAEQAHISDEPTATGAFPQDGDLTLGAGAGDTLVGLTLRPGEPGSNDTYVYLLPVEGEEASSGRQVGLQVEGRPPITMEGCGTACRLATTTVQGGETIDVTVSGDGGGTATFQLPAQLPAPEAAQLLSDLTARMNALRSYRYDETLGPADPPITSHWDLVAPDRLHGVVRTHDGVYETIRIGNRRWGKPTPQGPWRGGDAGGTSVTVPTHIWDYPDRIAPHIVGTDTVDAIATRVVSFFVDLDGSPIWYRLWVDDDAHVRKAEMRARGHFMDHHYYDFNAPITIDPPTVRDAGVGDEG